MSVAANVPRNERVRRYGWVPFTPTAFFFNRKPPTRKGGRLESHAFPYIPEPQTQQTRDGVDYVMISFHAHETQPHGTRKPNRPEGFWDFWPDKINYPTTLADLLFLFARVLLCWVCVCVFFFSLVFRRVYGRKGRWEAGRSSPGDGVDTWFRRKVYDFALSLDKPLRKLDLWPLIPIIRLSRKTPAGPFAFFAQQRPAWAAKKGRKCKRASVSWLTRKRKFVLVWPFLDSRDDSFSGPHLRSLPPPWFEARRAGAW